MSKKTRQSWRQMCQNLSKHKLADDTLSAEVARAEITHADLFVTICKQCNLKILGRYTLFGYNPKQLVIYPNVCSPPKNLGLYTFT